MSEKQKELEQVKTWDKIELAAKVIGHISQGMYRSPSGAIKELVSNAYDGGATLVKIHTGFPLFTEFTCEDNGDGISHSEFIRLMRGGIGDSTKQSSASHDDHGVNNRPIIGRLGVGMLSLAQICSQFKIVSHHAKSGTAFQAEIKFPPYTREEIDKIQAEMKETGKAFVKSGEFKIETIDYVKEQKGVKVTTTYLRETFRKTMTKLGNLGYRQLHGVQQSYPSFDDFIDAVTTVSSLYYAAPYDQLLYGLALASPLPYIEPSKGPKSFDSVILQIPEIEKIQKTLKSYDFAVEVDNISLRRPLVLPSNGKGIDTAHCIVPSKAEVLEFELEDDELKQPVKVRRYEIKVRDVLDKYQLFYFDYSDRVNGRELHFSGYVFLQTSRLFPKDCQGVLVRIRHVAIGEYDVNMMTYPLAEGPRYAMTSAEFFVHKGLDDALKVDRDGFNSLDPHYLRLQAFLHSILHGLIFKSAWTEEKGRNKQIRAEKAAAKEARFVTRLKSVTERSITKFNVVKEKAKPTDDLAHLDKDGRSITINTGHPSAKNLLGKKKYRELMTQVFAAFEIANQKSTAKERKATFYKLIENMSQ